MITFILVFQSRFLYSPCDNFPYAHDTPSPTDHLPTLLFHPSSWQALPHGILSVLPSFPELGTTMPPLFSLSHLYSPCNTSPPPPAPPLHRPYSPTLLFYLSSQLTLLHGILSVLLSFPPLDSFSLPLLAL